MPRTKEQVDEMRKKKRDLIMSVSLELFAENGYHATSISHIAQKAGISKGLMYNYFESKKKLLEDLILHGYNSIFENLDVNHDGILTKEEYIYFIDQSFNLLQHNLSHWKLFFSLLLQPKVTETFATSYTERIAPLYAMFIASQALPNLVPDP